MKQVSIIEAIRTIRHQRGMTCTELAIAVGVTHPTVLKWENIDGFPQAEKLPRIADALGVSIDALFGRDSIVTRNGGERHDIE